MKLHDLSPPEGSRTESVRKGRGRGARQGESCGRGNKGQKKRSKVPIYFEGGQTPIYRRFPKRGFTRPHVVNVEEVNVRSLGGFDDGAVITPEVLREAGLIDKLEPIKLLGDGSLEVALEIQVHRVSDGARRKVEDAGGSVELLDESTPST